jgi:hypothetical protein
MKSVFVAVLCGVCALLAFAGQAQATCSAQVICEVTVISCSGQSVCQSGPDWVQCDNQARIYCPVCQAQITCCDGRFMYCNGYSSCEETSNWIKCDGQIRGICPDCPNYGSLGSEIFMKEAVSCSQAGS